MNSHSYNQGYKTPIKDTDGMFTPWQVFWYTLLLLVAVGFILAGMASCTPRPEDADERSGDYVTDSIKAAQGRTTD